MMRTDHDNIAITWSDWITLVLINLFLIILTLIILIILVEVIINIVGSET